MTFQKSEESKSNKNSQKKITETGKKCLRKRPATPTGKVDIVTTNIVTQVKIASKVDLMHD